MSSRYEETLQRDIDRIRSKITGMAGLAERALKNALQALVQRNRPLAYTVILRDQRIDELEKEIDRLCLEFLVRQQPVAQPLRFVYATIKINLELERIGDYAESIARQALKVSSLEPQPSYEKFVAMANLSIPMLQQAVQAFVDQNPDLARSTMVIEEEVDMLRNGINAALLRQREEGKVTLEALTALMTIARRFERVSDQAKNICEEVLYMCTGEYQKHVGVDTWRVLFVDEHNSCRSQMAEAVANSLGQPRFIFSSAGLDPKSIDPMTVRFLKEKGLDLSRQTAKTLQQVPNLEHYHIVVGLAKDVQKALPPAPHKTVYLDWSVQDPTAVQGTSAEVRAAYEQTYQFVRDHIKDLVEALLGDADEEQSHQTKTHKT